MLVSYPRVSAQDQRPELQLDALKAAGCERVYTERASGAQRDRPELKAELDFVREGDTLVVWTLHWVTGSNRQLTEAIEPPPRAARWRSTSLPRSPSSSARFIRERTTAGLKAARARGRKGGRPRLLGETDLAATKAMLRDPSITVEEAARRLGVGPTTLYRHLRGGRNSLVEGGAS
jgi:DNA invertase Pin-like site-specific DNA recombinase